MAEISTELAVINDITTALSVIPDTVYDIVPAVQQAFDISIIQNMTKNIYQFENDIIDADYRIIDMNNDLRKAEEQTQKVAKKGDLLSSVYKKIASAVKKIEIKDVLNKSDEFAQTMSQLNSINDGSQSSSELFDMIYASAKNAHAPLMSTADAIVTMGNSAGNLFGNNQELIDFMNQMNKQFAIGGASATEQSSALEQLSQSMASGVIKGNEMNKILKAAPGIASTIEKNMGWAEGSLMSYAEQGKVTSEVVKASLLNMSDETNEAFENIPLTYSQVMINLQSDATKIFQPVLEKISSVTQSEMFGAFVSNAVTALSVVANITMSIMDAVGNVAGFIYDNWSVISPLIYGAITALGIYMLALGEYKAMQTINGVQKVISTVQEYVHAKAILANAKAYEKETIKTAEATVKQASFNTTLLASPVTWTTLTIIALVVAIAAFANWIAKTTGVAETGFGVIAGAVSVAAAVIVNILIGLANFIITMFVNLANVTSNFTAGFQLLFVNPIDGIKVMFLSLFDFIVGIVEGAASILDAIFGSSLAEAVAGFRNGIQAEIDTTLETNGIESEIFNAADIRLAGLDYGETWNKASAWGDEKMNKLTSGLEAFQYNSGEYDLGLSGTTEADIAATADNTASLNDSVDISNENLKYLKDVAEREAINRFTTAEIKVNMNNNNNISNGMDLDGVINYLTAGVTEAMGQAAEGVHA